MAVHAALLDARLPPESTERLFGFRYRLGMYPPASQHRDGYFVMPVLHGERLVGRAESPGEFVAAGR